MSKVKVEMPESILVNPDNWVYKEECHYMSGHMYRGTSMEAFESIDSCGTCDGARCDNCEKRTIPAHWELSINTDVLYDALKEAGLDENVASDLAYNDSGSPTHWLTWNYEPSEDVLKQLEAAKK